MKTTQLTDNLTQLTRLRFVNAYLLREVDGLTLIDTTTGGAHERILAAARTIGAPIRRIALTHGHADHVGSLDALKAALGDSVTVYMPQTDARIHAGERVVDGKIPGGWAKLVTTPDIEIADGDTIGSLRVVATHGHTPGHVSFLDTRDGSVIAGDVFTTIGGLQVTDHVHWRFPFAAMATWSKTADRDAAHAIQRLDPTLLAVGHGKAITSPADAIDDALTRTN